METEIFLVKNLPRDMKEGGKPWRFSWNPSSNLGLHEPGLNT
jgi:hypothetical protein